MIDMEYMADFNSSPPDKMTVISQMTFSDAFSWKKSFVFWSKFHKSFVPKGPIDNNPALI